MSGLHEMELINHLVHDVLSKDAFDLFYKSSTYDCPYFNETFKVFQIEQSKEYKGFEDIKNYHASNS